MVEIVVSAINFKYSPPNKCSIIINIKTIPFAQISPRLFLTQFLFTIKIKSTWRIVPPNTLILDLSAKQGSQCLVKIFGKIHVLGSTISKVLLILIPNRNCVRKSYGLIWQILGITSLNNVLSKFGGRWSASIKS